MLKNLLLILCLGVTTAFFYGCTQPQKAGEEAVQEEATSTAPPAATPAPTPMDDMGDSGTD